MMKEIVSVKLDNEMDIILAHKRAMKLAELSGCSMVVQTSIATAVSEISRCGVEHGHSASLALYIEPVHGKKFLRAEVNDFNDICTNSTEALSYAKRLADDLQVVVKPKGSQIIIKFQLTFGGTLTEQKINNIREYFEKEAPLSAYDELRRKIHQLQAMADKIRERENEYRILSDTLPLMMFSANTRGIITFANKWLQDFFGVIPKDLNGAAWQNLIHPQDYSLFIKDLAWLLSKQLTLNGQYRLKQKSNGNYLWHMLSITPLKDENEVVGGWIGFLVDINAQKLVEQTLKDNKELKDTQQQLFEYQGELERKVVELNRSNYELEQFAHLASHDLQEPLRKILFYSDTLRKKYSDSIAAPGIGILDSMTNAAARMRELIQDLLSYSQLHQQKLVLEEVDLNVVMQDIVKELDVAIKEKEASINYSSLPVLRGNALRLRQLFVNLITNSLKYSRREVRPVIDINSTHENGNVVIKVKDNGIGFDPQYSEKIFGLFERLHSRNEFPGTGIGLSICKKIAELHGGRISATAKEHEYALFEVHFPVQREFKDITTSYE
jgi:PAS domain S-box-containing protein